MSNNEQSIAELNVEIEKLKKQIMTGQKEERAVIIINPSYQSHQSQTFTEQYFIY